MDHDEIDITKLPDWFRDYLYNEAGVPEDAVKLHEVLDAYLRWEGIIGFTDRIMLIVNACSEKGFRTS